MVDDHKLEFVQACYACLQNKDVPSVLPRVDKREKVLKYSTNYIDDTAATQRGYVVFNTSYFIHSWYFMSSKKEVAMANCSIFMFTLGNSGFMETTSQ